MSLPPLPEPIYRYYNWLSESSLPNYSADQMREYGQQCYEQALLDAMNATRAFGPVALERFVELIRADEREQNAANLDDFTPDEYLLQSAWLCLEELGSQLMQDGVPVDPEHPKRQAMTHCYAVVSAIAKRLEKA